MRVSDSGLTSAVKNAVLSLTRAACCMLWVTMTMVNSVLRSCIRSSMRVVAMGSRAEQGSSMRMTSGRVAMVRAMHSRCCWPPDMSVAGDLSRDLTSSHRAALRRACSTMSSMLPFMFPIRGP